MGKTHKKTIKGQIQTSIVNTLVIGRIHTCLHPQLRRGYSGVSGKPHEELFQQESGVESAVAFEGEVEFRHPVQQLRRAVNSQTFDLRLRFFEKVRFVDSDLTQRFVNGNVASVGAGV